MTKDLKERANFRAIRMRDAGVFNYTYNANSQYEAEINAYLTGANEERKLVIAEIRKCCQEAARFTLDLQLSELEKILDEIEK